jgi:hydroxymethylpyrimidine pyrophosphatase-like HAD family hydrolase
MKTHFLKQRSQYLACSGGKLDFVPARRSNSYMTVSSNANIQNGVIEIDVPSIYSRIDSRIVQDAINAKLEGLSITSSSYSHIMHVMPEQVNLAAAYAYINWYLSVYGN